MLGRVDGNQVIIVSCIRGLLHVNSVSFDLVSQSQGCTLLITSVLQQCQPSALNDCTRLRHAPPSTDLSAVTASKNVELDSRYIEHVLTGVHMYTLVGTAETVLENGKLWTWH